MRLFVAILIPDKVKERIRDISRLFYKEKRNFKFTRPEQLHMTLKFLGNDVSDVSAELIIEKLQLHRSELKKVLITLDSIVFGFKGQIRPTVLSHLIKKNKELDTLTNKINSLIRETGIDDVEKKKDRATLIHHITIARAKSTVNRNFKRIVQEKLKGVPKKELAFEASEISLMKSELTKDGPTYKEFGRIKLT